MPPKHPITSGKFQSRYASAPQSISPLQNKQQQVESHPAKRKKLSWPVFLFFLSLLWPCVIFFGPLRLSLYRIVLLVMIFALLGHVYRRKSGNKDLRRRSAAFFILACPRLIVVDGIESSVQTLGIEWLETIGPYFLARCFIRDATISTTWSSYCSGSY